MKIVHVQIVISFVAFNLYDATASGFGKCPLYEHHPLDISRFTGRWYEIERSFYFFELAAKCTHLDIWNNTVGNLNIEVTTVNKWTHQEHNIYGTAILLYPKSSYFRFKINTNLPFSIARLLPGAGIYNVLYTDYDNFAILWSCKNYVLAFTDSLWILGRTLHITESQRIEIYEKITQAELNPERLMISKNENCNI